MSLEQSGRSASAPLSFNKSNLVHRHDCPSGYKQNASDHCDDVDDCVHGVTSKFAFSLFGLRTLSSLDQLDDLIVRLGRDASVFQEAKHLLDQIARRIAVIGRTAASWWIAPTKLTSHCSLPFLHAWLCVTRFPDQGT